MSTTGAMSTMTKYVSLRIVVDATDERLCGREACPRFVALDLDTLGRRVCSCGAFRSQLNGPPPIRRCDGCLEAKTL